MTINIHDILTHSRANGPGNRYVIWVQGCSLRCKGCWNPDTWSKDNRLLKTANEIFQDICEIHQQYPIEGVTITGGEPFEQSEALIPLALMIQQNNFNLMVFTGYVLENLNQPEQINFLKQIDWLIDGTYIDSQREDNLLLRGSSNQRLHYLSKKAFSLENHEIPSCEILIDRNGKLIISGIPDKDCLSFIKGEFNECLYSNSYTDD